MKRFNKKIMVACAGVVGLSTLLSLPVTSSAEGWHPYRPGWGPNHYWHPAGRWARNQNCRRFFYQRYCRNHNGWQQCYTVQRSRFICVY